MEKISGSGNRDEHPRTFSLSLETVFCVKNRVLKFFDADLDLEYGIFFDLDPGSGMEKIQIQDLA
jgi:hypothetical protein